MVDQDYGTITSFHGALSINSFSGNQHLGESLLGLLTLTSQSTDHKNVSSLQNTPLHYQVPKNCEINCICQRRIKNRQQCLTATLRMPTISPEKDRIRPFLLTAQKAYTIPYASINKAAIHRCSMKFEKSLLRTSKISPKCSPGSLRSSVGNHFLSPIPLYGI